MDLLLDLTIQSHRNRAEAARGIIGTEFEQIGFYGIDKNDFDTLVALAFKHGKFIVTELHDSE